MKMLKKAMNNERTAGIIFTMPFTIGFLLFMIVPMGISLYYSFCSYDILSPPVFTGLQNFKTMFADETFYKSIKVTFFFAFVSVPLRLLFALIVAMLLLKSTKMTGFYRAAYYLPSIIGGSVAVAILWKRMFATDGVINKLLQAVGINCTMSWLGNTKTAIWVLIILAVWQFGSSMLIFLAGLKQIPASLYEAATVDGGSRFRQFISITLPMLTPVLFFNLVQQTINAFMAFTQSFVITGGGPRDSTRFYCVYQYQRAFEFHEMGYASAMAWFMLVVIGILTALIFQSSTRWVYNESKEG